MPTLNPFKRHKHESNGDATPPEPHEHDYANAEQVPRSAEEAPVADAQGLVGNAEVYVDASKVDGRTESVGQAGQSRNTEGATLLSSEGTPVSGLPAGSKVVETILTSGAKGLGPEGTATLRSLQASATPVGVGEQHPPHAEAVVAPAKGLAPEAVLTTETPRVKGSSILRRRAGSATGDEVDKVEDKSGTSSVLNAISAVLPENILGVNLAPLGLSRDATKDKVAHIEALGGDEAAVEEGGSSKEPRHSLPTRLSAGAPPAGPAEEPGTGLIANPKVPQGLLDIEKESPEEDEKFHKLFDKIPAADKLVKGYPCALQRQVLLQGKLYLSQHHISFHANIFGVVTNLNIPLSEVVTIEKRNTALVIPNAIEFATLHARHNFASFLHRDDAFEHIVKVWRFTHPETGAPPVDAKKVTILDEHAAEDETSSVQSAGHRRASMSSTKPFGSGGVAQDSQSMVSVETTDTQGEKVKRKRHLPKLIASKLSLRGGKNGEHDSSPDEGGGDDDGEDGAEGGHAPTNRDESKDFKEVALDAKFNASPEKIFHLMWASGWMTKFLSETEKLTEIQMGDWEPEVDKVGSKRDMSYIKPLNASMGPKSTKCLLNDTVEEADEDKIYQTLTITKTPDVPAGSSFEVRTRVCITHAGGGRSRVYVTTEVHWSSVNRFLKGIIEKSAVEGQVSYHKDLSVEMRKHIKANAEEFGGVGGGDEDEHEDAAAGGATGSDSQGGAAGGFLSGLSLPSDPTVIALAVLVLVLLTSNIVLLVKLGKHGHSGNALNADVKSITSAIAQLDERMNTLKARAAKLAEL